MARRPGTAANATDRPSMADVAALAGVSSQTVSRVLAGRSNVRDSTREAVLDAARRLDYHPNFAARVLASGRTRILGLVTMETSSQSRVSVHNGVEVACRRLGYQLSTVGVGSLRMQDVNDAVKRLVAQGAEGVLLAVPLLDEPERDGFSASVPTVALNVRPSDASDLVAYDQVMAGRLATEHLLHLGHASVWHLAGPPDWSDSVAREHGWRTALLEAGRTPPIVLNGDWSAHSGFELGRDLAATADVTAVFVASDDMAFGLMAALAEAGRRIPEDVSIVGMDDGPLAAFAPTPLTTIRLDLVDLGRLAVQRLVAMLEEAGRTELGHELLVPELVVRRSTAPPRAGDAPGGSAGSAP